MTLLDGLVLARSIFNHSMNYRSVVILGKATLVDDPRKSSRPCGFCQNTSCPAAGADGANPTRAN